MKLNKKNNVFVLGFIFLFMLTILLVPLFNKGTKANDVIDELVDTLTLSCPETALSDEEVECSVLLNSTSITTQGILIKYVFPVGVSYVDFTTDSFEIQTSDENGVVLVNLDGLSGENISVGTLKVKMDKDLLSNQMYKIELVDATLGDGDDTVIELENVFDEIRIKSDINTLDSITLSDGELNESFDKNILEYTVTTYSDKIIINGVATDGDRATISGDVAVEKTLHYGTNDFNIKVTSESGLEKTYKVSVFRRYNFTTDKYLYNKDDNYIYVGTDIDNMLNNISVDSSLTKTVINNNLVISYENEKILEIKILSIDFNDYVLDGNVLYVDSVLPEEDFIKNIEFSEGITFDLDEEDKIKVLYDNIEIDSYDVIVYSLSFDSKLTIDEDNFYIKNLDLGMTIDEFLNNVSVNGGISKIFDKSGNEKGLDKLIATGDVLRVYLGDTIMDEYQLSVLGDSSGDGRLSAIDLAQFRKHLVNWVNPDTGIKFKLDGVYSEAFDLNKDGRISVTDLAIMRKKIVGLI